jgi:hypothetical protein
MGESFYICLIDILSFVQYLCDMKGKVIVCLMALVSLLSCVNDDIKAQQNVALCSDKPRLVVVIMVDNINNEQLEIVRSRCGKEGFNRIFNHGTQFASAYYDAMSEAGLLDDADAEGSEGFGQMTQDQADTLTARFTAVQMEMANVSATTQAMAGVVSLVGEDVKLGVAGIQSLLYNSNIALQMAQDQLDQMQIIADNTAMLAETNNRLKAIETNTSRL